ncbi:MAG: hypothetical protein ACK518_04485 [bacterium]
MAIVSKKDFAEALNVPYGTIRSKISRKQLCCNRKGFIDTENPKNYIYLVEMNGGDQSVFDKYHINGANVSKKRIAPTKNTENVANLLQNVSETKKSIIEKPSKNEGSVKVAPTVEIKEKKQVKSKKESVLSAEERKQARENRIKNESFLQYELRKKEAEVTLVERNAELKQMELEKKAGNTLPLDLIRKIEVINFQSLLNNFLLETKNMATVMVEKYGGTRSDVVDIENKLNQIFKRTVETTKKNVDKEIEAAVSEYTEVRSRGERK